MRNEHHTGRHTYISFNEKIRIITIGQAITINVSNGRLERDHFICVMIKGKKLSYRKEKHLTKC